MRAEGEERIVAAARRRQLVVDGRQDGEIGAGHLAGDLGGGQRRNDPAGVDELVRRRELLDAIEEEGPLLGKEERLPRIEGELPGVGLDLREVGIDRAVEREVRGDAPTDVRAELGAAAVVVPAEPAPRRRAVGPGGDGRVEIEHQAAAQVGEALERAGLRRETRRRRAAPAPSCLRRPVLWTDADTLRPQVCVVAGWYRRLLNGMRTSTS